METNNAPSNTEQNAYDEEVLERREFLKKAAETAGKVTLSAFTLTMLLESQKAGAASCVACCW